MPRRKNNLTKEKIAKLIREGRGQGEKENYIPWSQIGDFSSLGRGNRVSLYREKQGNCIEDERKSRITGMCQDVSE